MFALAGRRLTGNVRQMKACLFAVLILGLTGCVDAEKFKPVAVSTTNLTEREIRSLPVGVTFKEIEKRLRRYDAGAAIDVPMITFEIEGKKGMDCMMFFEDKTDRLLYAWTSLHDSESDSDAIVLWPKSEAGRKVMDLLPEIERKRGANRVAGSD